MNWYNMYDNTDILNKMQEEFEAWVEKHRDNYTAKDIDNTLEKIASKYDFTLWGKYTIISVFKNKYNELIIAWHDDHDRGWSIDEEGFDNSSSDLIEYYLKQDIISEDEYRNIFYNLVDFSKLPEKLREAIELYLEDPGLITAKEYQNLYHNIIKKNAEKFENIAEKYSQKAKVVRFFETIDFIKNTDFVEKE